MKKRIMIVMAAICFCGSFAAAEKVELTQIGSDAAWFTHFDMQKFDGSVLNKLADSHGLAKKCEDLKNFIGIDLKKDISGVTMYGTIDAPQKAVVIVKGNLGVERLTALAQKQPDYTAQDYDGLTIHSWQGHKGDKKSGCFYDGNTLLMSKSKEALIAGIDVLKGKATNISANGCITSQDAIFQMYMADASALASKSQHLMFLANVKQTLLAVGQKDSDVFSELIMHADSADNAVLLEQMIQGLLAMGQMQASRQNKAALEVLRKCNVSTEDSTVVNSVVLTTDEINTLLKNNKLSLADIKKKFSDGCKL